MILLTGSTGFVGTNLLGELGQRSLKVRCLVRDPARASAFLGSGCEVVRGDVTDRTSVLDAMGPDVDTVIHLVGILVEPRGVTFRQVHVEGTRNVVEACRQRGVRRYLHISALGTGPGSPSEYFRTKYEAEEIIRASGLEYTIFRPSVIFGREDRFTNLFAHAIRLSPVVMVPGSGKNKMQPVYVKDLVRAMAMSLEMEETRKRVYEIAGPGVLTFDEIIDGIAGVLGRRVIKMHVPMPLMRMGAGLMEVVLPRPPLSRDSLKMLGSDNTTGEKTLEAVFGIKPMGLVEGMKTYLH